MKAKETWQLCNVSDEEALAFSSFSKTWNQAGTMLDGNWMSNLMTVSVGSRQYYVKRYESRGRFLRRFIGRSRVRAEWENAQLFEQIGIPTARLVSYGEEKRRMGKRRGIVVTEGIAGATDLLKLLKEENSCFKKRDWVENVIQRLSVYVGTMHEQSFVHGDLQWRNILASSDDDTEVYIIDCPAGRKLRGGLLAPMLRRGRIKDLACLDKIAQGALTRTQRLKFYFRYAGLERLDVAHKREIGQILSFFEGRR